MANTLPKVVPNAFGTAAPTGIIANGKRASVGATVLVREPQRSRLAQQLEANALISRVRLLEGIVEARATFMDDSTRIAAAHCAHHTALAFLSAAPESVTRVLIVERVDDDVLHVAQRVGAVLCTEQQWGAQLSTIMEHAQRIATRGATPPHEQLDAEHMRILEQLALGAPLEQVLQAIVLMIEHVGDGKCSILLLDADTATVRHGAAPSLPRAWVEAINGQAIGPTAGSCGAAAHTGRPVFVHDIATHPNWEPYRQLALPLGLRACWSVPIRSASDEVLGTFAVYYDQPRDPGDQELRHVATASHLAALAITRQRQERALQLSHQRYRQLLETSHEGVLMLDLAARITFANQRAASMLGYAPGELIGQNAHALAHPSERARVEAVLGRRRAGVSEQYELHCIQRDGSDLWAIVAASPIVDERGRVIGMLKMLTDITERRRVEQALSRSELELRMIFDSTTLGLALLDTDVRPVRFNAALSQILGYDPTELRTISLPTRVHPDDFARVAEARNLLDQQGGSARMDIRMLQKSGQPVWVRVSTSRFKSHLPPSDTGLIGVSVFEDISDIKRLAEEHEAELRTIALQAALLDKARDAIVLCSMDQHVVRFWNAGATRLYGYASEEALGRSMLELVFRNDPTQLRKTERELAETGSFRGELRHFTKDGRELFVDASCTLVYGADEKPEAVLAIFSDCTEKKKLETHLMLTQRMESLGTLAGGIAHDFNNILAAIRGYLDLATACLPPQHVAQEHLSVVSTATDRAVELVQQILTFSRRKPAKREPCSLKPVVEEVLRLLRATLPRMIHIEAEYASDDVPVMADATQIHQIIMNLGTNAAQALGSHGTVSVRLSHVFLHERIVGVASEAPPGSYMRLTVADDGCGMDEATMARIFDPFFTTKQAGAGTGLGLSVVLGIVKDHGGVLNVASQPGVGTTFEMYLPEATLSQRNASKPRVQTHLQGQGQRIMVVDDEPALLMLETAYLERHGYRVEAFGSAHAALSAFRERSAEFAAVVTDLAMPELSGIELSAALQGIRPGTPTILASGYIRAEQREQAREAGVVAIVNKPDFLDPVTRELSRLLA